MKIGEIVILSQKILKTLSEADIKTSDWQYCELYNEYERAVATGAKVSAIVAVMAERYGISEASVWRVVKRMKKEVGVGVGCDRIAT